MRKYWVGVGLVIAVVAVMSVACSQRRAAILFEVSFPGSIGTT